MGLKKGKYAGEIYFRETVLYKHPVDELTEH
jgi:hypothetical protein